MRLRATIILTLKGMLVSWKQVLLMYAILPLILSLAMGYFQRDVFKPQTTVDKINITLVDKDNSKASQNFKEIFQSDGIKKLFNITNDGNYIITIPKGYEDNIINLKDTSIKVDEKSGGSHNNEIILKTIISEYGKGLTESSIIFDKINGLSVKDKEKLFSDITDNINKISSEQALKENMMKGEKTLTSYENQAASMISYVLFMMIMGCTACYYKDKENGSFKRLMSTPITRAAFFNLDLVIFFISSFIYGLLYVFTFRVAGFGFKDSNPLIILSILLCQSLLVTSIAGLLIAFANKNNTNIIVILFMYLQVIFGGMFIPAKDVSNKIFTTLTKFAPGNIISSVYKSCILFNSFDKIGKNVAIMLLVSIVMYGISILKVKTKWEE